MTAPVLIRPSTLEITDPGMAQLLIKEHVAGYLAQFIGVETTVGQAASRLGVRLNVMAYWTARFLRLNLVAITRTERRSGSAVNHYRSVAEEFTVSVGLIGGLNAAELLERVSAREYHPFCRNVSAAGLRLTPDWQLRLHRVDRGYGLSLEPCRAAELAGLPDRPLHDWCTVPLPAADALAFQRELAELLERFKRAARESPDLPHFTMHVGFVLHTP